MKRFKFRGLSVLLAMVMATTMFVALPLKAFAASENVTIVSTDSVAVNESAIQAAIDSVNTGGGGIVTVIGSKGNADEPLDLNIPSGVTVYWYADYGNIAAASFSGGALIILHNSGGTAGFFEITSGTVESSKNGVNAIEVGSGSDVAIRVQGASVIASGTGSSAINAGASTVWVSPGGYVEADDAAALAGTSGWINVVGGSVKSNNIAISTASGNVRIEGGTVEAGIQAIVVDSGTVEVWGGTVSCTDSASLANSAAITVGDGGTAMINGGSVSSTTSAIYVNGGVAGGVAAYLTGTCTGAFTVPGVGMIVEVDAIRIPASYNGTSTGLTTKAGGTAATWDTTGGGVPKIDFTLSGGSTPSITWSGVALPPYCEIVGGMTYTFLDDALFFVQDGETIRLLRDISLDNGLSIKNGKNFTLDLNGYALDIQKTWDGTPIPMIMPAPYPAALYVENATVTVVGGTLTANSNLLGVYVMPGGTIELGEDAAIDVTGSRFGVIAHGGGKATVTTVTITGGNYYTAIDAYGSGSEVTVTGDVNITGDYCKGVESSSGALVIVEGNVNVSGVDCVGIRASYPGGGVEVGGNVVATGANATGARVDSVGIIVIHGTITAPNYIDLAGTIVTARDFVRDYTGIETLYFEGFLLYMADNYQGFVYVGNNGENDELPRTGDNTGLLGGTVVLLAALLGISGIVAWKRRRQEVL